MPNECSHHPHSQMKNISKCIYVCSKSGERQDIAVNSDQKLFLLYIYPINMITKLIKLPILQFSPYRLDHKYGNFCTSYNKKVILE